VNQCPADLPILNLIESLVATRRMKRLQLSLSVSLSHAAICSDLVADIILAVKRGWLLILALQTTFNVQYFFFVVLVLVINSLPNTAAMLIIIVNKTRMSFIFFFSM
jgi:hypothetical protein